MATITKSLTIESQGTYNLTFDLWSYSEWAASAGITTSYASLAALIADEKAVRQLMTVHASVDFFANCTDSTIISTVINNDLCAKWINLRDYALDTLSAKSNIKSVMNTADKYGYGEWGKINSTTWGPLGNVPIMTANNAPYGVVSASSEYSASYPAWKAFDGVDNAPTDTWLSANGQGVNARIGFMFTTPICPKKIGYIVPNMSGTLSTVAGKIVYTNDGSTWTDLEAVTISADNPGTIHYIDVETNIYAMGWGIKFDAPNRIYDSTNKSAALAKLQFYGRELTKKRALIPTMTSRTEPSGTVTDVSNVSTNYPGWHLFDNTSVNSTANSINGFTVRYAFPSGTFVKPIIFELIGQANAGGRYYDAGVTIKASKDGTNYDTLVDLSQYIGNSYNRNTSPLIVNTSKYDNDGYNTFDITVKSAGSSAGNWPNFNEVQMYDFTVDYSEREFATGSTMKYIYDHGVELETISDNPISDGFSWASYSITAPNKKPSELELIGSSSFPVATTLNTINLSGYSYLRAVTPQFVNWSSNNAHLYLAVSTNKAFGASGAIPAYTQNYSNKDMTLDITSVSQSCYIVGQNSWSGSSCSITELWLE